jgi:hypothetical protein
MECDDSLLCSQSLTLIPILNQTNTVHTLTAIFRKIHFNIILPCALRSSESSLPFKLSKQNVYAFIIGPMRATRQAHLIHLDFIILIG